MSGSASIRQESSLIIHVRGRKVFGVSQIIISQVRRAAFPDYDRRDEGCIKMEFFKCVCFSKLFSRRGPYLVRSVGVCDFVSEIMGFTLSLFSGIFH